MNLKIFLENSSHYHTFPTKKLFEVKNLTNRN